jgi:hypothetical protein
VAVAKGYELRIVTALRDEGVRNISNCSSDVGGLRVKADVNERHLLQNEREGIGRGTT